MNPNEPIGKAIDEFLWEYWNDDITEFNVRCMAILSRVMQEETGQSLGEAFAEKFNIKTYSMHTDAAGKQYLIDPDTGKTKPVHKPWPHYLKPIK